MSTSPIRHPGRGIFRGATAVASLSLVCALAATQRASAELSAAETKEIIRKEDTKEEPFGQFMVKELPYSPTFGLAIWRSPGAVLSEISYAGEYRDEDEIRPGQADEIPEDQLVRVGDYLREEMESVGLDTSGLTPEAVKVKLAEKSLLWTDDYEKLGFNRQLRFSGNEGSALLLRVRDKFQMLNEESGAASFAWSDDRKSSKDGTSFNGALMLDLYQNRFYNEGFHLLPFWVRNPYRVWFRLAFEKEYNSLDEANRTDIQREYALLTFQANPDQDARIGFLKGLEISSPQILQLGVVHEDNLVSDVDSFRWIIGWEPRMLVNRGVFGTLLGRGFGLNNRMYYQKDKPFKLAASNDSPAQKAEQGAEDKTKAEGIIRERSHIYSFINPFVGVEGSSSSRINYPDIAGVTDLESLEKLKDEVITYDIAFGLGFDFDPQNYLSGDATATLSYALHGVEPVSDIGSGHMWHELRAELNLSQTYRALNGGEAGKKDWAGFTAYASYVFGEAPPSYVDTDLVTAGVSVKF